MSDQAPEPTANRIVVRGNRTLLLSTSAVAWQVTCGTVAVFVVRVADNVPVGPRRYLFSRQQGEWLFGSKPHPETDGMCFLVRGVEDSELSELPLSASQDGKTGVNITVQELTSWVRQVCDVTPERKLRLLAETVPTSRVVSIVAGQAVTPAVEGMVWLGVQSGSISIAGTAVTANDSLVPIVGDVVLVAETDAQFSLNTTLEISLVHVLANGLDCLHQICFGHTQREESRAQIRDSQRLLERRELQSLDTATAIRELGGILTNSKTKPYVEDNLMAALAVIGEVIGVTFRQPRRGDHATGIDEAVEAIARLSRVRVRRVSLRGDWWKRDAGPILGTFGDTGRPVALLRKREHYECFCPESQTSRRVDRNLDGQLSRDALTFMRPLPDNATSLFKLGMFAVRPIAPELAIIVFLSLAVALLGMLVPISTGLVIDEAIPDANLPLLYQLAAGLVAMAFAQAALNFSQSTILLRSDTVTTSGLQAAVIDRLLRLPAKFFRRYSSGDLQNRAMMITEISKEISYTAIGGILTGTMATLNMFLCFYYNARLAMIAIASAVLLAVYTSGLSVAIRSKTRDLVLGQGALFGFQVQLIAGISKLHVAGAEQRAFNHWARRMAAQLRLISGIQRLEQWGGLINSALYQGSTICLYYFAATSLVSAAAGASLGGAAPALLTMGTFLAFYAAFHKMIEGMTGLSNAVVSLADSWAKRRLVLPLLEEGPENPEDRADPGLLQGSLAVSQVSFRYRQDGPLILNNVNLRADPGQFIAIVGPSGCGKSTLLRLMLGFETPETGTIGFDGQDLAGLDLIAVRRQIGVVLQSGVVNSGTIFENLAGASRITLDEAWNAARSTGLDSDIEQMPMGMHSIVNEGGSTLSGGQRQRLLIARALVKNPRILLFDEATSALDNRTQQIVTDSLDRLKVTRIVVAHRMSTIRQAHCIYLMQEGRIMQSGTFEELASEEGLFRRMMARQMA